jgi:hypothetical protein
VSQTPLKPLNPLNEPNWDERVLASGSTCVFHSRAWIQTLTESYGCEPVFLTRSRDALFDMLIPLMHVQSWATGRRGVSLPFSDNCQWIIPAGDSEAVFERLHEEGRLRRWRYLETRNGMHGSKPAPVFERLWHHELLLTPSASTLWQGLKSEVHTALRKAQGAGVEVRFTHDLADLREFYRLHSLTRRNQGIPPQPWMFFERLYRNVIVSGLGEVGIAFQKGVTLASAIYFYFGHSALYKFGASDPRLLTLRANNALMWAAITRCAQMGFTELSLGRTDLTNEGLRRFKLGWGCRESPLDYFRYDYRLETFLKKTGKSAQWPHCFIRHSPLLLIKLVGKLLYPHRS